MARKRKAYAPFSLTSEAGVAQTPLEGYIDVDQQIYPIVNTGTVNENGKWSGVKSSDDEFFAITKHVNVANAGETLSPDTGDTNFIDMTGFNDLFLAIKPTRTGSYQIRAVMGPDTERFANLSPVNPGVGLRGSYNNASAAIVDLLVDSSETLTADVWNINVIGNRLKNQKLMQLMITNDSGGTSTIEVAFMRIV